MNDYDLRQLKLMRQRLDAYQAGQMELGSLISDLEALLDVLESTPAGWRDSFREQWGILEQVYSVAIVREQLVESAENEALIAPALVKLRTMIDEAIGD